MKNIFKNLFYIFLVSILLSACQSVKDGLTGKKQNNTDEFLVEKKNPLVLPTEFNKLPEPKSLKDQSINSQEVDLQNILTKNKPIKKNSSTKNSNSSLEKSILEKINSN